MGYYHHPAGTGSRKYYYYRRKGNDWFIGGMCATAKEVMLNFSFLSNGNYTVTICKDGINADRNAMDDVIEEKQLIKMTLFKYTWHQPGGF